MTLRHVVLGAMALLIVAPGVAHAVAAPVPAIPAYRQVAELHGRHVVRAGPAPGAVVTATVAATRPITGAPTALPVIARRTDASGRAWLRVRLPGRVLGGTVPPRTGWIGAERTTVSWTPWYVLVDTARRRVIVYHRGRWNRSFRAIVGHRTTPTPAGEFFVEETVVMPSGAVGAPYALALSARSAVLQEFAGGPGQTALHGLHNVGGTLGTAASHGCVRLGDSDISWLAKRMGPGVPVTIR